MTISPTENFRAILSVVPHGPAAEVGMKAGDTVLAIDDVGTSDLTKNEFIEKMRGKPGSEVHLTILTKETGVILYLTLKRVSAGAITASND